MKLLLLLISLTFTLLLAEDSIRPPPGFLMPPTTPKYCRRTHAYSAISANECTIASIAACGKNVASLLFRISSGPLPHFRLSFVKPGRGDSARVYNHIAYDRIIEYKDTDSELGYQPAKDTILNTHWLGEGYGPNVPNFKWTPLTRTLIPIPDGSGDQITRISFSLRKFFQAKFLANIQFGVDITPKEITVNGTMKQILTPNSFKITVDITNITFVDPTASGFALGSVIVTAGSIRARGNTTIVRDGDRPDDQTTTQDAWGVPDGDDKTVDGSAIGWQRGLFSRWAVNGTLEGVIKSSDMITTGFNEILATDGGVDIISGYKATRVWFSVNGQPTDIHWDPTVAAGDITPPNTMSSAASIIPSFMLIVALIALCL
jgi:hypothetical protein